MIGWAVFKDKGPFAKDQTTEALNWALMRGSRSGRVAWQFAKDWAAQHGKRPAGRRT